jgi:hypothetical protein
MIDKLLGDHPEYFGYALLAFILLFGVAWIYAALSKGDEDDKAMAAIWDKIMKLFGRGGAVIIFALLIPGCATNSEGENVVDREKCLNACVAGALAQGACTAFINPADDEAVAHCRNAISLAVAACKLGCGFAEDVE